MGKDSKGPVHRSPEGQQTGVFSGDNRRSLSDAGRLRTDKALGLLVGMDRWAEESTLSEWLCAQNASALVEIWRITREFVAWVLLKVKSSRVRRDGKLEVFFDDTQIEESGRKFEGTAMRARSLSSRLRPAPRFERCRLPVSIFSPTAARVPENTLTCSTN